MRQGLSLWKFAEENPSDSQTQKNPSDSQTQPQALTMNIQAQPLTSTLVKPSGSQTQTQAPAQARPQAPAQAQPQPPAQAQPPRLPQAYLPQPQAVVRLLIRRAPSDSLYDEDNLFMDFTESEAFLIAKQACSKLLDQVTAFSSPERVDTEDHKKVINLSLPWHSSAVEIADHNFNIVTGKLSKCMKSLNPAKPLGRLSLP